MSIKMIFNSSGLLSFTENDRVLSAQLLTMALQDIPEFFSSVCDHVEKKQYRDAAVCIHKIKGIAGTVGAEILYELCISTEEDFRKTNPVTDDLSLLTAMTDSINDFCNNSDVLGWIADV